MNSDETYDAVTRQGSEGVDSSPSEFMRSVLLEMPPEEVSRQLPNLVETIREESESSEDVQNFVIGVSFSKNDTLLDYRLERLVEYPEYDSPKLETVKPAVTGRHMYLTLVYPPDPKFDASTLRGALLTVIEQEHLPPSLSPRRPSGNTGSVSDESSGILKRLWQSLF